MTTLRTAYDVTLWRDQTPVLVRAGSRVVVPESEVCELRPRGVPIIHLAMWPRACGPVLASALVASGNGAHTIG